MEKIKKYLTLWAIGATAVITASTLMAATYAWFSANRKVETEKITARTGSANLVLRISDQEDFVPRTDKDADGNEINVVALTALGDRRLMPVSTADLKTFVYSPYTDGGEATLDTLKVPSEQKLAQIVYRQTIYLRLDSDSAMAEGIQANLYLDAPAATKTPEEEAAEKRLLNAARLGLTIGDKWVILRYSDDGKDAESNTLLDGKRLKTGQVLTFADDAVTAKDIPPENQGLLSDYQYSEKNASPKPLLEGMKPGTVYPLEILFYLEGCDPDCGRDVMEQEAGLGLAFYAALA